MIKYICKKCSINSESSVCPNCGERAEVVESSVFWCDDCNIPLYSEACPLCGKQAHRLCSDIRPVFPEERLLLEIIRSMNYHRKIHIINLTTIWESF